MAIDQNTTSGPNGVQVFEVTMDNHEDQDELNRRLRRPGEPACRDAVKPVNAANAMLLATEAAQECQDPV